MNRYDNIGWICRYLLDENPGYRQMSVPQSLEERQRLMRALLNIRPPMPVSEEFLRAQDAGLQAQLSDKGVVEIDGEGLLEWKGDNPTTGQVPEKIESYTNCLFLDQHLPAA